ncbi:hypothetical protein EV702DRAFT_1236872 [Suillus placidus]|uniref:Uncharacterized protein n=1 Tax=Suillus placidus TaxID=48579 RepID=A0A9P6ZSD1_9AGAM|nr:hypothetical protein EV702DRAFT_1236872 [Suillus placidus]
MSAPWQRRFDWERDPNKPDSDSEQEEESPLTEHHEDDQIPDTFYDDQTDQKDEGTTSTSSDEFPEETAPRQLAANPSFRMLTSSTKPASELKAGMLNEFSGDPGDAQRWLYSLKAFYLLNDKIYDSDAKKVGTALAYMTADFCQQHEVQNCTDKFLSLLIKKSFGPLRSSMPPLTATSKSSIPR